MGVTLKTGISKSTQETQTIRYDLSKKQYYPEKQAFRRDYGNIFPIKKAQKNFAR